MKWIALFSIMSLFIAAKNFGNKQLAEVNQQQGFYLFVDSKPVSDYEYLGTVKVRSFSFKVQTEQYQSVRDALIKDAKKMYPNGDGLIFNFQVGAPNTADVIKLKE